MYTQTCSWMGKDLFWVFPASMLYVFLWIHGLRRHYTVGWWAQNISLCLSVMWFYSNFAVLCLSSFWRARWGSSGPHRNTGSDARTRSYMSPRRTHRSDRQPLSPQTVWGRRPCWETRVSLRYSMFGYWIYCILHVCLKRPAFTRGPFQF